jgi:hypothetical protein
MFDLKWKHGSTVIGRVRLCLRKMEWRRGRGRMRGGFVEVCVGPLGLQAARHASITVSAKNVHHLLLHRMLRGNPRLVYMRLKSMIVQRIDTRSPNSTIGTLRFSVSVASKGVVYKIWWHCTWAHTVRVYRVARFTV